jgi:hypothetical protein
LISKNHAALYSRLYEIAEHIGFALENGKIDKLNNLTKEHQNVMVQLEKIGLSNNRNLIDLLQKLYEKIQEIRYKMKKSRDDLHNKLVTIGKKKNQILGYNRRY